MEILSELGIGLQNVWWFSGIYGIVNFLCISFYKKKYARRLLKAPHFNSIVEKILAMITMFAHIGIIVYSFFLSVQLFTIWFYCGIVIYSIGMTAYISAMRTYAFTDPQIPVSTGIYRISRHPMQIMTVVIFFAIGIIAKSLFIVSLSILILCTTYPTFIAQERDCLKQYGEAYKRYMETTPRYLFFR